MIPGYDPYAMDAEDLYYFDEAEAQKHIDFFHEELTLTKGKWKGQPFIPFDWAEQVIRCLFGWKSKEDHTRRYSTLFIYVPRKNAKSELVAGIAVDVFYTDNEPDNEKP